MWRKSFIKYFVAILYLLSFLWLSKALFLDQYPDFTTQYFVPKMILSGQNPYSGGGALFTSQVYPPTVFFVYLPISFLPIQIASHLFTFLSLVALVLSLYLLSKIFDLKFLGTTNLTIMTLVFMLFPVKFTLGMGQINLFILLIMVLILYFIKKQNEFIAGIFLGLSIVIKLFPLFLPVYLLLKFKKGNRGLMLPWTRLRLWYRKKQLKDDLEMLDGLLLVVALAGLLIVFLIPKELYLQFFFETLPSLLNSWKTDYYNQALSGFIGRSFGTQETGNLLKLGLSLVITMTTLFIITKNDDDKFASSALKFGTLITLSLILNNFSWQHHYVWIIIPFYATFNYLRRIEAGTLSYIILLVSYFFVAINFKYPQQLPVFFQSHVLYGSLILLVLNLYLHYKKQLANAPD